MRAASPSPISPAGHSADRQREPPAAIVIPPEFDDLPIRAVSSSTTAPLCWRHRLQPRLSTLTRRSFAKGYDQALSSSSTPRRHPPGLDDSAPPSLQGAAVATYPAPRSLPPSSIPSIPPAAINGSLTPINRPATSSCFSAMAKTTPPRLPERSRRYVPAHAHRHYAIVNGRPRQFSDGLRTLRT